jgi:hypothetical protein
MRQTLIATASALALIASGAALAASPSTDSGAALQGGSTAGMDRTFNSYTSFGDRYEAEVDSQYAADDLMERDILDSEGRRIGTVYDVVVDDTFHDYVMIDAGPYLGTETYWVPLSTTELVLVQGSGGDYEVDLTRNDLLERGQFERGEDDNWAPVQ